MATQFEPQSVCPGALSVGTHSIKARAQSARGAVAESALLSFTVVSAQVALTQPFARGYYGPLNGSAYGPTQVQGQPRCSMGCSAPLAVAIE
jgi:hypothetical protein